MKQRLCGILIISGMVLLTAALSTVGCSAKSRGASTDDGSQLVGNWTGESICVGNNPYCHDEKVVYRIAKSTDKADTFVITMDKIVDGKPENMAVLDFKYDAANGTLVGEFQNARYHGLWEFTVKGDVIEGTLSLLPSKTVGRRVKVVKDK